MLAWHEVLKTSGNIRILSLLLLVLTSFSSSLTKCRAQADSLFIEIDSTLFITDRHTSSVKAISGKITEVSLEQIQDLPNILGNTDPVRFIRSLPGVQTNSEYDSGIHIQGCDNAHNEISIAGVPIYGVSHLFGLFSIFNPSHFDRMRFSTSSEENRLGGALEMTLPDTLSQPITGDINIGLISSQGSMGISAGKKSHFRISARQSYMNLLYRQWMKIGPSPIGYGFGDYNLSWQINPSAKDRIYLEGYFGQDKANISESTFDVGLGLQWRNYAGSAHWEHDGHKSRSHHVLYFSGYDSHSILRQDISSISLDTHIRTSGYKGDIKWNNGYLGLDLTHFDVLPQSPYSEGLYSTEGPVQKSQNAWEASIYGGYQAIFADRWRIHAALRGNAYLSPEKKLYCSLSPALSASFNAYRYGKISASYRWNRQHLFQSGLSNIGLPIEFWFMAGRYSDPQYARSADLTYELNLLNQALSVSTCLYFKRLYNQVEYKGDLFDFFNSIYRLEDHLLKGDGWNYGLNLMLHKQSGNLTGWISYSIGRALRRFENNGFNGIFPANHERIHELNAVCTYRLGDWVLSGSFVFASGAPFTAPAYYYISSGQLITKPGEHNACRMRPYVRLDLSATYEFIRGNQINISIYNATGRRNDVMYRLNVKDGIYSYGPMSFFLRWIPSVSYRYKF